MGTSLADVIEQCGGPMPGREIKAVLAGFAGGALDAGRLGTPLTYEHFEAVGSGLGAAGFVVYDDSARMVEVAAMVSRFLYVESCGQCPPCKLGTGYVTAVLDRLSAGGGTEADIARLHERLRIVTDGSRCYLSAQERTVIASLLARFPLTSSPTSKAAVRPRASYQYRRSST